jgi:hypothetical protein
VVVLHLIARMSLLQNDPPTAPSRSYPLRLPPPRRGRALTPAPSPAMPVVGWRPLDAVRLPLSPISSSASLHVFWPTALAARP